MNEVSTKALPAVVDALLGSAMTHDVDEAYPANMPEGISIQNFSQAKKVTKPWGFELWLSDGTETPYAFKLLYIKKGTKTSLQYHNEKVEHNCLLAGEILFHYKDEVTGEVESTHLTAGHVVTVKPPAVHRVEALTDIILMEASTNHLDDVVRISDDYERPDGKIATEHESK